jgi:hypothetical protein
MSITMMSRLMLNLHERAGVGIFSTDPAAQDAPVFTSRHVTTVVELSTQRDSDVEHLPVTAQIGAHDFNTHHRYTPGT